MPDTATFEEAVGPQAATYEDAMRPMPLDAREVPEQPVSYEEAMGTAPAKWQEIPNPDQSGDADLHAASAADYAARQAATEQAVKQNADAYDTVSKRFSALSDMIGDNPQKQAALQAAFENESAKLGVMQIGEPRGIPKTTPDQIKTLFPTAPDWVHKAVAGAAQGAEGLSDAFMGSPEALMTVAAGASGAPEIQMVGRVIGAGFVGGMAEDLPSQVAAFSRALGSGDTEGVFREGTGLAGSALALGAAARHGIFPAAGAPIDVPSEVTFEEAMKPPVPEDRQLTQGASNATDQEQEQSGVQPERPNGNESGPPAETSGGDSLQPTAPGAPGPSAVPPAPGGGHPQSPQLPLAAAAIGGAFNATTPVEGVPVSGKFDLVEAGDLVSSYDKGFDPALQPRDRNRIASANQVATIVQKFDPPRLADSPTSDMGSPFVDEYNQVLSGNGRTAAIRAVYDNHPVKADRYKDWLTMNAGEFGLTPEQVQGMKQPVLVRRVADYGGIDKTEFARQSNQQQVLGMGEAEKAVADAKMLLGNPGLLEAFAPGEEGNILAASNRDFLNRFIQGTGDQATLLTKDGYNTAALEKRVKNAVLGAFVGPENQQLMSKLVEGADSLNIKSAVNGVMAAAPALMKFKGTDYDLTPIVHQALKDLVTIRTSDTQLADFLGQSSLFTDPDRTYQSDLTLEHLATSKSAKAVTEYLLRYAAGAKQALLDAQSGGMFGEKAATRQEIVQRIYDATKGQSKGQDQTNLPVGKPPAGQETGLEPPQPGGEPGLPGAPGDQGKVTPPKAFAMATPGGGKKGATPAAPARSVPSAPSLPPTPAKVLAPVMANFQSLRRWFNGLVSPQNIDPTARVFSTILRHRNAEMALNLVRADEAMAKYRSLFDKTPVPSNWKYDPAQPLPNNYAVMDAFERDRANLPPSLQKLADIFDEEFAWRIGIVQSLKPTAMQNLIADYFPHMWKNPESAAVRSFMAEVAGRNPLEGSKAFLKKRTLPFVVDGLARGLVPLSDNPVDMLLAKMHQMDKFIMAQKVLQQASGAGMRKWLPIGQRLPAMWKIVDDPAFTVYAPPYLEVREAFDAGLRTGLMNLLKKLGFPYQRLPSIAGYPDAWGLYQQGGQITAKFGAPDLVIMHELGHGLDERYGLQKILSTGAGDELEKLASLRVPPGKKAGQKFKDYIQMPEEQVANALHAYMYAPELGAKTAPRVMENLRRFIAANPELHDLEEIKPSLSIASEKMRLPLVGPVLAGHYIMPDGAAQVLTNHLSPSLQRWQAFRTLKAGTNILNAAQLGFSGFHIGFTSLDAVFSTLGTALNEAARGNLKDAGKLALQSLTAPVSNYYRGKVVQQQMIEPGKGYIRALGLKVPYNVPEAHAIANLAVRAGLRATVDPFFKTTFTRSLVRAFHEEGFKSKLAIPFLAPMAVIEQSVRPIAEFIVPRQKLGVFATLAESELRKLGPGATSQQVNLAMARAADSTENRMGQMTYDNLFYNRIAKDVLLLGFRSYGWQLGKYREMFGAGADAVKAAADVASMRKPDFTNRLGYVAALVMGSAVIGAVMTKLFTGKNPQTAMDYFHPQVAVNQDGSPVRLSMPTYMKDLESDWHDFPDLGKIGTSFYHKLNPALGWAVDSLRNVDFYDVRIRNQDDPWYRQAMQQLQFTLKTAEPFSLTGTLRLKQDNAGVAQLALPFFGFTPAKKSLTMTPAESKAAEITQANLPQGARTSEQFEHSTLLRTLANDLRLNPTTGRAELIDAIKTGQFKPTDLKTVLEKTVLTPLQYQVHRSDMTATQAMQVWDLANPQERDTLRTEIAEKVLHSKTIDVDIRQRYLTVLFKR